MTAEKTITEEVNPEINHKKNPHLSISGDFRIKSILQNY
jgi:hypothetical protein